MSRARVGVGVSGTDTWTITVKPVHPAAGRLPWQRWQWNAYKPERLGTFADSAFGFALTRDGAHRRAQRYRRDEIRRVEKWRARIARSIREDA